MNINKLKRSILFILLSGLLCISSLVSKVAAQKPWNGQIAQTSGGLKERVTMPKTREIELARDKNFAGVFIIKFVEGSHVRYRDGNFTSSKDQLNKEELRRLWRSNLSADSVVKEVNTVNDTIAAYAKEYGFAVVGTFAGEQNKQDPEAQFREKEKLESAGGTELADLDLYYTIAAKDLKDIDVQQRFMNALNRFSIIEDVRPAFLVENASVKIYGPAEPIGERPLWLDTPDLSSQQGYLDPAPVGIDARFAWGIEGGKGRLFKLIDVEYDWQTNHEDFSRSSFWGGRSVCSSVTPDADHGTAVMGIVNAPHNGFGVNGIVPDIRYGLANLCRADYLGGIFPALFSGENVEGRMHNFGVAAAINDAARVLAPGDVLLIEQHVHGPQGEWLPMEYYQECLDAISRAASQGIVVVEAAGNGGMNLDDARYGGRFNRDSGALMVGAGNGGGNNDRASFSNYGTPVDVQGWGENVVTLGYGENAARQRVPPWYIGDVTRQYTPRFSGTSSASPIVAGAVLSIQGARRARNLVPLTASGLKDLFSRTGTRQGSASASQNIGPLPDLRNAIIDTLGGTSGAGSAGFTGPGTYIIQAVHSGKVLDISGARLDQGSPLLQYERRDGDNQKFIIGSLPGGFVTIKPKHSGLCLDVPGHSYVPLMGLHQWRCNNAQNQQFVIERAGDFYKIKVRYDGMYLDILGASLADSASVIQYPATGGSNQLFRFIPTR